MKHVLAALTFLLVSLAVAEPPPQKLELAKSLVRVLRFEGMFEAYLKACTEPQNTTFDAKTEFLATPGRFGGISPQSAYWPEVEAIYRRFRNRSCSYATAENFSAYLAERYAEVLSVEDLKAAIAFHSSAVGRRLGDATLKVNQDFQAYAVKLSGEAYDQADAEFQRDLRALVRRYKAEPK